MTENKRKLNKHTVILFFAVFLIAAGLIGWLLFRETRIRGEGSVAVLNPDVSADNSVQFLREQNRLVISEVMHHNSAVLSDESGDFPDWIELYNASASDISLSNHSLSDKQGGGWAFPDITLKSEEYLIVFADGKDTVIGNELHTDFSLSDDEEIYLISPAGQLLSSFSCIPCENDHSVFFDPEQETCRISAYPTPGYANTTAGYLHYQMSLPLPEGLYISEVKVDGSDTLQTSDYIELGNASSSPVDLSKYFLSDDFNNLQNWQLPSRRLEPGEYIFFPCKGDAGSESIPFSLNSTSEHLYLSDRSGLIDYLSVKDIPAGATFGRTPAIPGMFYYPAATPGLPNEGGYRRVSETPLALVPAGIYNDAEDLLVTLSSSGVIHYTLDCSEPTTESPVYSGPIALSSTTVLKAVSFEYGMMPSRTGVFSYILNENHTLPVLSLVGKDPEALEDLRDDYKKAPEIEGSLSLFEPDGSFTVNCGITLSGNTSLRLAYKSFKVHFRSCYGDSKLDYNLFNNGITEFDSLTLRKGQDNHALVFTNEMWEDLARSMSDTLIVQGSKFCILYLNGEYYGIVSLREDFSKQFYASRYNVPKTTVERADYPFDPSGDFYMQIVDFTRRHRTLDDEGYAYLCEKLDMDSFIDWIIMEGLCGNFDLCRNVVFFRSSAEDGKWHTAFYDVDNAFKTPFQGVLGMTTFLSEETTFIVKSLLTNRQFLERFLVRYSEVYDKALSTSAILSTMERYKTLLTPEIKRDRNTWGFNERDWVLRVSKEENNISSWDWSNRAVKAFFTYTFTPAEYVQEYFPALGNWDPSVGISPTEPMDPDGDGISDSNGNAATDPNEGGTSDPNEGSASSPNEGNASDHNGDSTPAPNEGGTADPNENGALNPDDMNTQSQEDINDA